MTNFSAYLAENPKYFEYLKSRIEDIDMSSSVQSLPEEEIALLEEENNKSEDELIEEVDDVLSTNEGE